MPRRVGRQARRRSRPPGTCSVTTRRSPCRSRALDVSRTISDHTQRSEPTGPSSVPRLAASSRRGWSSTPMGDIAILRFPSIGSVWGQYKQGAVRLGNELVHREAPFTLARSALTQPVHPRRHRVSDPVNHPFSGRATAGMQTFGGAGSLAVSQRAGPVRVVPIESLAGLATPGMLLLAGGLIASVLGHARRSARRRQRNDRSSRKKRRKQDRAEVTRPVSLRFRPGRRRAMQRAHRASFAERDQDVVAAHTNGMRLDRAGRRRTKDAAVSYVEGRAVYGAQDAIAAQSSFAHSRLGMGAHVVDGEEAVLEAAEQHLTAVDLDAFHLARTELAGRGNTLIDGFPHFVSHPGLPIRQRSRNSSSVMLTRRILDSW